MVAAYRLEKIDLSQSRAGLLTGGNRETDIASIQRPLIAQHGDGGSRHHECRDRLQDQGNFRKAVSLQENATHDAKEIGERQHFSDSLCPVRHLYPNQPTEAARVAD
jgi:hypothetical protein